MRCLSFRANVVVVSLHGIRSRIGHMTPGWAHAGNTPFRLYKQNQHEGGISSPLVVHWPAGLQDSSWFLQIDGTSDWDTWRHFLDVGNATYPKQIGTRVIDPLQGLSLNPIFRGEQRKPHDTLYFHFGTDRALRQGDWKLVSAKRGRWELYNMDVDRTELHDLAAEQPDRVKAMSAEWFDMAKNLDRLEGKQLAEVKEELANIRFRKDTSGQLSGEREKAK